MSPAQRTPLACYWMERMPFAKKMTRVYLTFCNLQANCLILFVLLFQVLHIVFSYYARCDRFNVVTTCSINLCICLNSVVSKLLVPLPSFSIEKLSRPPVDVVAPPGVIFFYTNLPFLCVVCIQNGILITSLHLLVTVSGPLGGGAPANCKPLPYLFNEVFSIQMSMCKHRR